MLVPRGVVVATSTATAKDLVTTSPAGVAVAADGSGMALDGFGPPLCLVILDHLDCYMFSRRSFFDIDVVF